MPQNKSKLTAFIRQSFGPSATAQPLSIQRNSLLTSGLMTSTEQQVLIVSAKPQTTSAIGLTSTAVVPSFSVTACNTRTIFLPHDASKSDIQNHILDLWPRRAFFIQFSTFFRFHKSKQIPQQTFTAAYKPKSVTKKRKTLFKPIFMFEKVQNQTTVCKNIFRTQPVMLPLVPGKPVLSR